MNAPRRSAGRRRITSRRKPRSEARRGVVGEAMDLMPVLGVSRSSIGLTGARVMLGETSTRCLVTVERPAVTVSGVEGRRG